MLCSPDQCLLLVGFRGCPASLSFVSSTAVLLPTSLPFKSPLVSSPCAEPCRSPQPPVSSYHRCLSLQSLQSFPKSLAHFFSALFLKSSAGIGMSILPIQGLLAAHRLKVQLLGTGPNTLGDLPSLSCLGACTLPFVQRAVHSLALDRGLLLAASIPNGLFFICLMSVLLREVAYSVPTSLCIRVSPGLVKTHLAGPSPRVPRSVV